MALLRLKSLNKTFGGVTALRDVSLDLHAGQVHALVGENGAGKSTLIKIITGAHRPGSGEIEFAGERVEEHSPRAARDRGIAVIYQQPALFPDLTVAENIALRLEGCRSLQIIRWRERRRRAKELLSQVGADISPGAIVRNLSMPEQQLVEIASAIGGRARLLILDEPTASLSEREVKNLLRVVRDLKQRGVAVVYISHRLDELADIADVVSVLRDGSLIATRPMGEISRSELIHLMVGREVSQVFPKQQITPGSTVLSLRGVCCRATNVRDVSFDVRAGEIVGLAGLVGAGRTELARVLFGLTPADAGDILLNGRAVHISSPGAASALGIAYVPEDRRQHGVVMDMSVALNTTLATLGRVSRAGWLDYRGERATAERFVNSLGTRTASVDAAVSTLSGGNQQKVALARWLAAKPAVLILDEPTQGVDVGAKAEIHRLMGDLARQGMAILMISSEMPEVLGMSDRVVAMRAGRVAGVLDRADATQQRVLQLALGDADGTVAA